MNKPQKMASQENLFPTKWKIRWKFQSLAGILFTAGLIICVHYYLTSENEHPQLAIEAQITRKQSENEYRPPAVEAQNTRNKSVLTCDLFSGKWVYDNISYPLYKDRECSFMIDFACEEYGRKEIKYQNWRWQPNDCDLPRFNPTAFLEKIKGKRVVFVGDSLNRNQYVSLMCMLEPSISPSSRSYIWKGNFIMVQVAEQNATIEFYWSPLLVESNCDDIANHSVPNRIVRIESIEKHAREWTDADILIFNSFMWWLPPKMTLLWGSFGSPDATYKTVETRHRRFEMAIRTWSDWLEFNVNRTKTKMFFMSISPFHQLGEDWGLAQGENCHDEMEPIFNESYWGSLTDREMMWTQESALHELEMRGLHIEYLNITHLSDYRKDAHLSMSRKHYASPTKEELSNPKHYADCVHWCLPGVPDVWNEILYSYILKL